MIPQRVKLKGFLCYKDEQEIGFDGNATLWMLSGLNGSGKSSIFDAVTYALFGHHRGGGRDAHELINKESDSLLAEFDFLLDSKAFRVKRTLRRDTKGGARGTQQLFRFDPATSPDNGGGAGKWVPIEDTGNRDGFNKWINENIGLTYETFTSSVLLLQGKAEKLLDSKPEGRRAVLASIVDLERYEELHARADEERKMLKGRLDALSDRLAALPAVAPEEVTQAEQGIQVAEMVRDQARQEVERLRQLEFQARAWVELQGRLGAARLRWQEAQRLLGDGAAIEQAVARLQELREVLPRLHEIVRLRTQIHQAEVKSKTLEQERQRTVEQLAQSDSALNQGRNKRSSLQTLIATHETKQREVTAQLRTVTAQLEKLKEYERQSADRVRIQEVLKTLPADPSAEVVRAREACEALMSLAQVVPQLVRFHSARAELRQALQREQSAQVRQLEVETRGKQLATEVKQLEPLVEEAAQIAQHANDQATEAKTLLQQARESLREVAQLDGAKVCRHCGQALTAGHIQEEKKRRGGEVQRGELRLKQANETLQAARQKEQALRQQHAQAQKVYQEARDEYKDCQGQLRQAQADLARLRELCAQLYAEVAEPHRQRISRVPVADWLATAFPTNEDIEALRSEAAGLTAARQRQQQAEQTQQQWDKHRAQDSAALANLERLEKELPAQREGIRQQHNDLDLTDKTLDSELKTHRRSLKETDADIDRLMREHQEIQADLTRLDGQVRNEELARQHARQAMTTNLKALPPNWQAQGEEAGLADLHLWDREREELEAAGTEERGRRLQQARVGVDTLRQECERLEAQQETSPAEARCEPAVVQAQLSQAKQAEATCDRDLGSARQQLALLENYRHQREQVGREYTQLERDLMEQRILTELLGRDRLQLYLVRQAERQVVEYANAVLDRLSGGQLYLKLTGEANGEGNSAKALELEAYNRSTGEKPINVAFLSGSQKFRVAVSLALGIGQYASRQHRPIESVIIDEGFGCLDCQGRQVMIQELQNLRSQMRCILLVSHQEEFAEAFSDGYHFALEAGATRVTRFQK
jgi:exonuclease SbcC